MSYREDAARLARALTDLLSTDPVAPAPLTGRQVQAALVCRDTVLGAVRDLTGALLSQTPPPLQAAPDLLAHSPAHALHAALTGLPSADGRDLALTDALAVPAATPVAGWQRAARAAALLETYRDSASALPGPTAWSLARDLATLSSALPALDVDLATTITTAVTESGATRAGEPGEPVTVLLHGPSHGLLQLAAVELGAHTADVPLAAAALTGQSRSPLRPVRYLADLPAAGRQLAELLHHRGSHLTVTEARAALQGVTYGVDLTARALTANTQPGQGPPGSSAPDPDVRPSSADAAGQLRAAVPDLQHLIYSQLATLTPSAPSVLLLSQQIQARLAEAGALHDTLPADPATATRRAALDQALSQWAVSAAPLVEVVRAGLNAAAADRLLFAPRSDAGPGPGENLLWLPVQHTVTDPHPALQAAERAGEALHRAATSLTAQHAHAQGDRPAPAGRAAADAAAAFGQLTAALQARPARAWVNPTRTAHPTLPRPVIKQPPHHR